MNALVRTDEFAPDTATKIEFTVHEVRTIAIHALEREGTRIMRTLHEIEYADTGELDSRPIMGTVLEPIATALRSHGLDVDYTYGSVRRALDFHPIAMHMSFCDCENGTEIACDDVACALQAVEELNTHHLLGRAIDLHGRWNH